MLIAAASPCSRPLSTTQPVSQYHRSSSRYHGLGVLPSAVCKKCDRGQPVRESKNRVQSDCKLCHNEWRERKKLRDQAEQRLQQGHPGHAAAAIVRDLAPQHPARQSQSGGFATAGSHGAATAGVLHSGMRRQMAAEGRGGPPAGLPLLTGGFNAVESRLHMPGSLNGDVAAMMASSDAGDEVRTH